MVIDVKKKLQEGFISAFVDNNMNSDVNYRPQFVLNNNKLGQKVLTTLEAEFNNCDEFFISVAFITMSGLVPLLQTLQELEDNGVPGKIITTDYLSFSEPSALDKLNSFSNIELRFFCAGESGFHTKGYIFRKDAEYRMIVGSSNLTSNALTRNEEWNTKIVALKEGEYTKNICTRFDELWENDNTKHYDEIAESYRENYAAQKALRQGAGFVGINEAVGNYIIRLRPNLMQEQFVKNMRYLQSRGARRALLISATGTEKTYASAFAVRDFAPKRLLFLVHREQIAKQAQKSYQRVLGQRARDEMGMLSGNVKNIDKRYLFSTMQSMARDDTLMQFSPDTFDFIVIDEAHRGGAASYQKIVNYFRPKFLLGMTASPDRTDGYDIYQLFDYNIAYEIRLKQALEEDFLCPFHYFGITDAYLDNIKIKDMALAQAVQVLTEDERLDYVLQKANFYGFSGSRVKGLVFCSRNEEAQRLSEKMNRRINPATGTYYRTVNVAGTTSQQEREHAIEQLATDTITKDYLDYIFSVDIFNEGVDIPEINQVIMLRPTQSPIVFVQQLGRGLRKYQDKEYVVILDFIGNYVENNFMIPIALSGDRSYNKDNIRRCVMEGNRLIPGSSTIHFDKIAKQRIFQSIDNTNLGDVKIIKENYQRLRRKLGKIPTLMDFDRYGEMDITCVFRNKSLGSYYCFLQKYEKNDYKIKLNNLEDKFIKYISCKFGDGKRPHELEILLLLLSGERRLFAVLAERLQEKYQIAFKVNTKKNLINIMTANFATGTAAKTFADCVFIARNGEDYQASEIFAKCLSNTDFAAMVRELAEFALARYTKNYSAGNSNSGFKLYQKYSYEDVCRLLEWSNSVVPLNIGGYKYDAATNTYPVFINYDKGENISEATAYYDRFVNNYQLIAVSKNNRTPESDDVKRFLQATQTDTPVDLFVRKNKDDKEAKSFYYLGRMEAKSYKKINMAGKDAVEIFWQLAVPVREDIYDYLTSEVL
ncbi:MAG: DEAD/DEAH box helicase [Anaerovibrio sp.]|nr:DEAD/DEAH box helicase [Anaerovibrio sp.]